MRVTTYLIALAQLHFSLSLLTNSCLNFSLPQVLPLLTPPAINPDIGRTTPELIVAHGYPVENYTITTDDGYILTYFRVPYGKTAASAAHSGKPVVLLVHGLMGSSAQWLFQNDDKNLVYQLVEEGYDVWLANSRGTSYSLGHENLSNSNPDYWEFSWEQMGYYDIPAAIDFILGFTGQSNLFYIGHSQGTTQFFVMLSLRPEYNSKIKLMSAYAPVAFMSRVRGPLRLLAPAAAAISLLEAGSFTGFQATPQLLLDLIHTYAPGACTPELTAYALCQNVFFLIAGFDPAQTNLTAIPQQLSVFPDSSAFNQFLHYGQEMQSELFARFDYGPVRNQVEYGSSIPTDFNISAITAPIALYWADNDWLAHPLDVAEFGNQLIMNTTLVRNYRVPFAKFNHLDFAFGINASDFVYRPTIELMNIYLTKQK